LAAAFKQSKVQTFAACQAHYKIFIAENLLSASKMHEGEQQKKLGTPTIQC